MTKTAAACGIPWRLEDFGCAVLPLPGDDSIAAVARSQVKGLLPTLGLAVQDVHDLAIMVSELATNVLQHATSGDGSPGAELWVYQRSDERGRDELVIKAFDTLRHWRRRREAPGDMHEHGRGLEIIRILADGRWGHHPSRSRLSSPAVRGKATWFALPVTRTVHARRHARKVEEPHAMRTLERLLVQRGVDRFQRRDELGVSVLTGPGDLTVWCETATFRWCARSGETGKLPVSDITEVCEQVVRLYEALDDRG
ncbi:ATP-binding protein [Actinomadura sp. 3N508]|uniref:ATP-binding protein n=1 Tax=Actinomadura sp. 3N508 TaxID=3375153 RepID=UPI0037A3D787